jgi:hypothetical protein
VQRSLRGLVVAPIGSAKPLSVYSGVSAPDLSSASAGSDEADGERRRYFVEAQSAAAHRRKSASLGVDSSLL